MCRCDLADQAPLRESTGSCNIGRGFGILRQMLNEQYARAY